MIHKNYYYLQKKVECEKYVIDNWNRDEHPLPTPQQYVPVNMPLIYSHDQIHGYNAPTETQPLMQENNILVYNPPAPEQMPEVDCNQTELMYNPPSN